MRVRMAVKLILLVCGYFTLTTFGQTTMCNVNGNLIECSIKESTPEVIGPIEVPNRAHVVIKITEKSPFDDCSLGEIKLTEIKQPDPLVTILQLLAKASGFTIPSGSSGLSDSNLKTLASSPGRDLLEELLVWRARLEDKNARVKGKIGAAGDLARRLDLLFSSPPRNVTDYNSRVPALEAEIESITGDAEPSLESEQLRYPAMRDRLKVLITPGVAATDIVIPAAEEALNDVAGLLAAIKTNNEALIATRGQLRIVLAYLQQIDNEVRSGNVFEKELSLLGYTQQAVATSMSCTNSFTKKATMVQVPITILFKNDPALSISVGALLSAIPKQKIGIVPIKTGVDNNGVPTFNDVFAVVDRAGTQIIPFSFINYRLVYLGGKSNSLIRPTFSLHISGGVGLNPNNGNNEVEYFIGPALGIKKFFIQFGDHIGRYQKGLNGGFNLGDTVPANFPTGLPINRVYKHGFGIAFSYKLPL